MISSPQNINAKPTMLDQQHQGSPPDQVSRKKPNFFFAFVLTCSLIIKFVQIKLN